MKQTNLNSREEFVNHKIFVIKELARLETMDWGKDEMVAASISPYILVEAINILLNSEIIENPIDRVTTGEDAQILFNTILTEGK